MVGTGKSLPGTSLYICHVFCCHVCALKSSSQKEKKCTCSLTRILLFSRSLIYMVYSHQTAPFLFQLAC